MTKLEEAEEQLRDRRGMSVQQMASISDELDRLRAEVKRLHGDMVDVACGDCLKRDANGFLDCVDSSLPVEEWCVTCCNRDARSAAIASDDRRRLVKLEAELAALKGEAERTVYVGLGDPGEGDPDLDGTALDALSEAANGYGCASIADAGNPEDGNVFAVRLSARKVEP